MSRSSFNELLIEVAKCPLLWDISLNEYRRTSNKVPLWEEVQEVLQNVEPTDKKTCRKGQESRDVAVGGELQREPVSGRGLAAGNPVDVSWPVKQRPARCAGTIRGYSNVVQSALASGRRSRLVRATVRRRRTWGTSTIGDPASEAPTAAIPADSGNHSNSGATSSTRRRDAMARRRKLIDVNETRRHGTVNTLTLLRFVL
ncbi:hypothetical protein HPB50_000643 [Hyalomma asiaticum]|uniref:Uncharacterized protein n=1 Tax=Hyalomma asiaticum TaxID=266040 RepID=A0ACB7TGH7_HYAAI|nr:hypothetical protein HPB50_000643 [Hyalomma asiaticum]